MSLVDNLSRYTPIALMCYKWSHYALRILRTISENHRNPLKIAPHLPIYIKSREKKIEKDLSFHTRVTAPHLVGLFTEILDTIST